MYIRLVVHSASMPSLSSFAKGVPSNSLEHLAGTRNWWPAYPAFKPRGHQSWSLSHQSKADGKVTYSCQHAQDELLCEGSTTALPRQPAEQHSQYIYADSILAGRVVTQVCS
jgi:hypothetical protein